MTKPIRAHTSAKHVDYVKTNPHLSIDDLAINMGIPRDKVSKLIKEHNIDRQKRGTSKYGTHCRYDPEIDHVEIRLAHKRGLNVSQIQKIVNKDRGLGTGKPLFNRYRVIDAMKFIGIKPRDDEGWQ